jgi:hypothetical protein
MGVSLYHPPPVLTDVLPHAGCAREKWVLSSSIHVLTSLGHQQKLTKFAGLIVKEFIYVLHRNEEQSFCEFAVASRVICTLRGHVGRFVRYEHRWVKLHELVDFAVIKTELIDLGLRINFYNSYGFNLEHGQPLPFIDPQRDWWVGVYRS